MKEVENLIQGSREWIEARKNYLGGSDVAVIMGVSKWKTPLQLWEEKLGISENDVSDKKALFELGHRMELKARNILEMRKGYKLPPLVIKKEDLEYCMVSLDGYNIEENDLVEIKYVGRDVYLKMKHEAYVPEHYYPQLQYQMLATGVEKMTLVGLTMDKLKRELEPNKMFKDLVEVDVYFNPIYAKEMITACNKFYDCIINKTKPESSAGDYQEVTNPDLIIAMESYRELFKDFNLIQEQLLECEKKIIGLMVSDKVIFKGYSFELEEVKGEVQWNEIPELIGVNLDEYRPVITKLKTGVKK